MFDIDSMFIEKEESVPGDDNSHICGKRFLITMNNLMHDTGIVLK